MPTFQPKIDVLHPTGDGKLTWKEYYNITYGFVNPSELETNNLANGHNSYSEVSDLLWGISIAPSHDSLNVCKDQESVN